MRVKILGSGSSVPHPRRTSSAIWVETPEAKVLLDSAPSAIHRMPAEGCDWAGLDAIWISHFHLDHCGGLAPLLFSLKYAPGTASRTKPLRIFGPAGIGGLVAAFDGVNNYRLLEQPFPVEVTETETSEPFAIAAGLTAVTAKTPHTPESHAVHLRDAAGPTLVFTSDTGFHEPLAAFARHTDLFILECSFIRNKPVATHLELAEAIWLIHRAEPARAVLTHLYPEWDATDLHTELAPFNPRCEILAAQDGLMLEW
ncbi:MAG: ribonuclease Z [Acidobacteria bacterium]|nr:ribonuclease Z [Acidobacteriota bacterium]